MQHKNSSIATLVALLLLLGSTVVLSGFGISNYRAERSRLNQELTEDHISWVEQLAVSLALPAWNFDHEQINKIIESSMHHPQVAAVVMRWNGANAAPHIRIRDGQWRIQEADTAPDAIGLWTQTRDITVNGDVLGTVTVLVTTKLMQASLTATLRWTLFMILLFDVLMVCGLYLLLWRLVLKPIKTLERQAAALGMDTDLHDALTELKFWGELENLRASLQHTVQLLQQRYEAMRQSEERFELAVAGTSEGIWDWQLNTDEVYYSPQYRRLLGYQSVAEFPPTPQSFWEHLHANDQYAVQAALQRHFTERVPYDVEFRLCTRSGEYRWFRARAQAHWDMTGKAIRMAGSVTDIHEQRNVQESLHLAQARELRAREEFAQNLLTAQEQERKRIANELHDSVGQNLSLIASRTQLALMTTDVPAAIGAHLNATIELVMATIAEIRALAQNLQPLHIEQLGLTESIDALIDQVAESSRITIDKRLDNVDDVLTGSNATHVYRIVQEALSNILKHAKALQVRINLERDVHHVRLTISDDGSGFDVKFRSRKGGLGLASIQERAHILGGHLQIDSTPGHGSALRVELPLIDPTVTDVLNKQGVLNATT